MTDLSSLAGRVGLPDSLRVLADAFPRATWEGHANFGEMVQFWMQRHGMFRDLIARIEADAQAFVDGDRDAQAFKANLARYGGFFLNELHMHHQVEDAHYFPRLAALDARIGHGFDMLEADHEAIDGLLKRFADGANAALREDEVSTIREQAGVFLDDARRFHTLLERHLTDEEDLVVPVVLKTGFDG